jgi:hypothetical protein
MAKPLARIALLLALVLVLFTLAIPINAIDFLRTEYAWLGHAATQVEALAPKLDMDHLVAFAVLGFASAFGWRGAGIVKVTLAAGALGAVTEVVQFWVPGRSPSVADALLDVVGAVVGYSLGWLMTQLSRRRPKRSS